MNRPATDAPFTLHDDLPYAQQLIDHHLPTWMRSASPQTLQQMRQAIGKTPAWLKHAHLDQPQVLRALNDEHVRGLEPHARLRAQLGKLPDLQRYASEHLTHAIEQRLGLTLDVSRTFLFNAAKAAAYKLTLDGDLLVDGQRALKLATQSLLHCALQNFEASEAQPGGMDEGSLKAMILDSDEFVLVTATGQVLDLAPDRFAALCRELDIGASYQRLIAAALADTSDGQDDLFAQVERSDWRQQVHLARLQAHIDPEQYETLLSLADNGQAQYRDSPVQCNTLQLFGTPLSDAMVIGAVPYPGEWMPYAIDIVPFKGLLITYLPGADIPLKAHASVFEVQTWLREQLLSMPQSELLRLLPAERTAGVLRALENCLRPLTWNAELGLYHPQLDEQAWVDVSLQPFTRSFIDELVAYKRQRLIEDGLFHAVPTAFEDRKTAARRLAYFVDLGLQALSLAAFVIPGLGQLMLGLSAVQLSYEVFEGLDSWAHGEKEQALSYLMDIVENLALSAALGAIGHEGGTPVLEQVAVETPSFIEELEPITRADGHPALWRGDMLPFAHDTVLPAGLRPGPDGLYQHDGKAWLAVEERLFRVERSPATGEDRLAHPHDPHSHQPLLRHNGAGLWLLPLERPRLWTGQRLFSRLDPLAAELDTATAARILSVSDTSEAVLRRVVCEQQRPPALLQDTLLRFTLDHAVRLAYPDAEPARLRALFSERYALRTASTAPGVDVLRRHYPGLPSAVAEEVLAATSASEAERLAQNEVPLRLAEELRHYQQQVRLARAYEGLYLSSVRNWDSDRLTLHSLARLPHWPGQWRVELISDHAALPADAIGPQISENTISVVSSADGYRLLEPATAEPAAHASLLEAIVLGLDEAARQALAIAGDDAPGQLRQRIAQSAQMPRDALRQLLGQQPIRPGWRSPMRLADGRQGYPLGHTTPPGPGVSRRSLVSLIRQLNEGIETTQSMRQILTTLEEQGLTRRDIDTRLRELLIQRDVLQSQLSAWQESSQLLARQPLAELQRLFASIRQHWYDSALASTDEAPLPLRLERVVLADFPLPLPQPYSSAVRHLQLIDAQPHDFAGWSEHEQPLTSLFRQFPALEVLEISRQASADAGPSAFLFSPSLIATHLTQLESLSILNQSIALTTSDLNSLRRLPRLRRLDLSGNRLSSDYPAEFAGLRLDYLGLDSMGLDHWPESLDSAVLSQLGELSLRDNQIRSLPAFLLEAELQPTEHPHISLQGNAIASSHLQRVLMSEDGRAARFHADLTPALQARLSQLSQQRQQLRNALDDWASASSSQLSVSHALMLSRRRISNAVTEYWRTLEQGLTHAPLRLDSIALEHFPVQLPAFFCRSVRTLTLTRVSGSTEQLRQLLLQFPHITRLTIDEHIAPQADLLRAVQHLATLSELSLRDSGLLVDQTMIDLLAPLNTLSSLDLSGNRLGEISQVPPALRNLHRLDLNSTHLQHWPSWVDSVLPLELLDLSDNQLTELPEHILVNLDNDFPISSISLFGNPLGDDAIHRARTSSISQRSYTFAMDIPERLLLPGSSEEGSIGGHLHNPLLDPAADTPQLEDWRQGNDLLDQALQDSWQALSDSTDADNLLALVGRLKQAAPYRNGQSRSDFCERVRKVLVLAQVNVEDRLLFNAIAEEALLQPETGEQTCHDGALLVFQNIELLVSSRRLQTEREDTEENLYGELRRLFRLHELDRIARNNASGRDEAEVRLAYRNGLNRDLALGVPQDGMLYAPWAHLDEEELTRAMGQVQRAEGSESFLRYASGNPRWVEVLRYTHPEAFAAIEQQFRSQVSELTERNPDRPIEQLADEIHALERDKQAREQRLIRELTIAANPERP